MSPHKTKQTSSTECREGIPAKGNHMDAENLLKSRILITLGEFADITGQSREGVRNRADAGTLGIPIVHAAVDEDTEGDSVDSGKALRRRRFVRVSDVRRMLDAVEGPPLSQTT